jgi:hypothetical protein
MSPSRRRPKPPVSSPVGEAGKAIARQVLRRLWVALVIALFVVPANDTDRTSVPPEVIQAIIEERVPALEWTADASAMSLLIPVAVGKLPPPGPNQKRSGQCKAPEKDIGGGCWVAIVGEKPPCDPVDGEERRMWPHDGLCWMPVGRAARAPTTGEPRAPTVAEPPP